MNGHQSDPTITDDALVARLGGGRFQNLFLLGAGGMGEVYRADDTRLHRPVAIKRIRAMHLQNPEMRARLERECRLHARLGVHQHIVALYDTIEENGEMMLVMEFVEGKTLQGCMESERPEDRLPLSDALLVLAQVLEALAQIHSAGIVHRDLKPANILVRRDAKGAPTAKLLDFGIARRMESETSAALTAEGHSPGTPVFMAPEQIDPNQYGKVTERTDIYAMGIIAYQLASGRKPFTGSTMEILSGHLMRQPPIIEFSPATPDTQRLWDVILRALEKDPAKRLPDARTFRDQVLEIRAAMVGRPAAPNEITILEPMGPLPETPAAMNATVLASGPPRQDTPPTMLAHDHGQRPAGRRLSLVLVIAVAALLLVMVAGGGVAALLLLNRARSKGNTPATATQPPRAAAVEVAQAPPPAVAEIPAPTPAAATPAGAAAATTAQPATGTGEPATDATPTPSAMDILNQRLESAPSPAPRTPAVRAVDPTPAPQASPAPPTAPPPTLAPPTPVPPASASAELKLLATLSSSAYFLDGAGRNVTLKLRTPVEIQGGVTATLDAISTRDGEAIVTIRRGDQVERKTYRLAQ